MIIEKFIEKAIEGGYLYQRGENFLPIGDDNSHVLTRWKNAEYQVKEPTGKCEKHPIGSKHCDDCTKHKRVRVGKTTRQEELAIHFAWGCGTRDTYMFLDPLAWQAVGKVENWRNHSTGWFAYKSPWCEKMHAMIDALAEGKSIEEFIETL